MKIGVNATSPATLTACRQLAERGFVDYIELMLDNFVHLPGREVRAYLGSQEVAIHIMSSRFLHLSGRQMRQTASVFRDFYEPLEPLYVSDHLGLHEIDGRRLPEMIDADYTDANAVERCAEWQEALGTRLHLENYACSDVAHGSQVGFFETLARVADVGILFDISNAVIAERNAGAPAESWLSAELSVSHCHISGFRRSHVDRALFVDSHDALVASASWGLLDTFLERARIPQTLTVEHDDPASQAVWTSNILQARRRI